MASYLQKEHSPILKDICSILNLRETNKHMKSVYIIKHTTDNRMLLGLEFEPVLSLTTHIYSVESFTTKNN